MTRSNQPVVWTFALALCLGWTLPLTAQNVYKDYVRDRNAQYTPVDYVNRGSVYKMQTGHFGAYGHCDEDRLKMESPYIDWHCRTPDCWLPVWYAKDLCRDIFRKQERHQNSVGGCGWGCLPGFGKKKSCPSGNCGNSSCDGQCVQNPNRGYDSLRQGVQPTQAYAGSDARRTVQTRRNTPQHTNAMAPQSGGGIYSRYSTSGKSSSPSQASYTERTSEDRSYESNQSNRNEYNFRANSTRQTQQTERAGFSLSTGHPSLKEYRPKRALYATQLQNSAPLDSPKLNRTSNEPRNSNDQRNAATNSTRSVNQPTDPQHFQFQLIGGSANR